MKKTYHLFNSGTMERKDNTLKYTPVEYNKNENEHEPGYLRMDVTYLPKFDGNKSYLFVVIDKATRLTWQSEKRTLRKTTFSGRRKTCGEQSRTMVYLKT